MNIPVEDVVNSTDERESSAAKATDYYPFVWDQIKQRAPQALLLRGPAHLNPVQGGGSTDLDVLASDGLPVVRTLLKEHGFYRVYKPQAYLERFRLQRWSVPEACTVDLYRLERWGLGFRLPRRAKEPADPALACLLHATADGKGTAYFEKEHGGPPWHPSIAFRVSGCGQDGGVPQRGPEFAFGPLGRAFWRAGSPGLLTLYLLFRGVIRPEPLLIVRNLCRRVAYRTWQMIRKEGLEVALLGVDGTGKTSLANVLLRLPAPVKVIYMGPHDFQTGLMRFALRHHLPLLIRQIAYRYDLLVRRITGYLLARRGWIVVYDRHPAERLDPREKSLRNWLKDLVDGLYAWPVDVTVWLTGDYPTLYNRKREYSAAELGTIDERFRTVLEHYRIPFEKIDVTKNHLAFVQNVICQHVLAKHQERISLDRLPSFFRERLV